MQAALIDKRHGCEWLQNKERMGNDLKSKVWCKLLFAIYIVFTIKVIIFKYPYTEMLTTISDWNPGRIAEGFRGANFTLFRTIQMYISYWDRLNSAENLFGNIAVFIPYGILYPLVVKDLCSFERLLFRVFLFSLGIEFFQMCTSFGVFDVDDILLNCFGAVLGFLIYWIVQKKGALHD